MWLTSLPEFQHSIIGLSLRHRRRRIKPAAVFFDEVDEAFDGFAFGDVELHGGLADVEIDLLGSAADVAEVGVGHFTGTVDDAAHDGDAHAFEMTRGGADFLRGGLQVEECAAAAGTSDVVGLENAYAGGLQDVVADAQSLPGGVFAIHDRRVANAIAKQRANVGGGGEQVLGEVIAASGLQSVFEQDRMTWLQFGCEQAIRGNDW